MPEDGVRAQVFGLRELDAMLADLDTVTARQVGLEALRRAAAPVVETAKALAPRGATRTHGRHLGDTIVARASLGRNQRRQRTRAGFAEVFVGPTAPHAHLVEFGHLLKRRPRGRPGKGDRMRLQIIGHVPAHPFMRPAWDAHAAEMPGLIGKELGLVLAEKLARWKAIAASNRITRQAERVLYG